MDADYINSLAVRVKNGDERAADLLLGEMHKRMKRHAEKFLNNVCKYVLLEEFDDIYAILQHQTVLACGSYDPAVKEDFLPRAYQFWNNRLASLVRPLKRKGRYGGLKESVDLDQCGEECGGGDFTDQTHAKIEAEKILRLNLDERQKTAVAGCLSHQSLRAIADRNPRLFKHHSDVARCLKSIAELVEMRTA